MSSSFEELLKKAKALKAKAKSPLVRQRLLEILGLLLDLAFDDEDAGPAPAKRPRLEPAPTPPPTTNSTSNNNNDDDNDKGMDEAAAPTLPPKAKMQQKEKKKKNGWQTVKGPKKGTPHATNAQRPADAPTQSLLLRQEDWDIPVRTAQDFEDPTPPASGVLLIPKDTSDAGRHEWVERLRGLSVLAKNSGFGLVSFRPLSSNPEQEQKLPMLFSKGGVTVCRDVYTWYTDEVKPKVKFATVEVQDSTTVIQAVVRKSALSAVTQKLLNDLKTAAPAMAELVKRATLQLDVKTQHNRVFHVTTYSDRTEASVRVPVAKKMELLRSSGRYGVFWRTISFVKGGYQEPILWLKTEATLKEALRVHEVVKSDGVVSAAKRYGLRMGSGDDLERYRTAAGNLACEPRDTSGLLYEVRGASPTEEADDVMRSLQSSWQCVSRKSYRTKGSLVLIVESASAPQWPILCRSNRSSLHITECTTDALRHKKSKGKTYVGAVKRQKVTLSMEDFPALSPDPSNASRGVKRTATGQPAPAPTPATADDRSLFKRAIDMFSRSPAREEMAEDVELPDAESEEGDKEEVHVHAWNQSHTVVVQTKDAACACCATKIKHNHGANKCPGCDALICATCFGNSQ